MGRETQETWRRRVERFRKSGLTTKEFAEREVVSARTLSWWRWKLTKGSDRRRARAVKRRRAGKRAIGFVEIVGATAMSAAATDAFEVELSRGYRVRVPARFEAEALRRLLGVLEGR